jgi:hypothetical protein
VPPYSGTVSVHPVALTHVGVYATPLTSIVFTCTGAVPEINTVELLIAKLLPLLVVMLNAVFV